MLFIVMMWSLGASNLQNPRSKSGLRQPSPAAAVNSFNWLAAALPLYKAETFRRKGRPSENGAFTDPQSNPSSSYLSCSQPETKQSLRFLLCE
eukprot:s4955_g4.t1